MHVRGTISFFICATGLSSPGVSPVYKYFRSPISPFLGGVDGAADAAFVFEEEVEVGILDLFDGSTITDCVVECVDISSSALTSWALSELFVIPVFRTIVPVLVG